MNRQDDAIQINKNNKNTLVYNNKKKNVRVVSFPSLYYILFYSCISLQHNSNKRPRRQRSLTSKNHGAMNNAKLILEY